MHLQKPLIKFGWLRALIYALAIVGAVILIRQYAILVAAVFLITFSCRKFLDGKSFISLGFNLKNYSNEAMLGFFTAVALLGIGSIILFFSGYLAFIDVSYSNEVLMEVGFLIAVAFIEELIFRGYLLNNLMQSFNKWVALFITALLFAIAHSANPGANILPVVNVFAAGILLGINYIYTKNLWFSILFHFSWNLFQGPVLGYDVSGIEMTSLVEQTLDGPVLFTGGPFGFEGSIICLALILVTIIVFAYLFSLRYEPYLNEG